MKTKTIKLPKDLFDKLSLGLQEVVEEFSKTRAGTVIMDEEVTFDDGATMVIQVVSCSDEPCYAQGVLYLDGCEADCTETIDSLNDSFEINEYCVKVEAE